MRRATSQLKPPIQAHREFLSTLSLRRATALSCFLVGCINNFYPRSPCGERPSKRYPVILGRAISIHALLAESDHETTPCKVAETQFLSTLSLRRATVVLHIVGGAGKFLSTLSLRRATPGKIRILDDILHFYPRSPCGERLLGRAEVV